jgi:hypothetical protein
LLAFTTTERIEVWVAAASIAVALATFVLALMTRGMAKRTEDLAKETERIAKATEDLATHAFSELKAVERQADAAREQVEALTRPWLTDLPQAHPQRGSTVSSSPENVSFQLHLRNVGQGLALTVPSECYLREYSSESAKPTKLRRGLVIPAAVPPGESCRIAFEFEAGGTWSGNPILRLFLTDKELLLSPCASWLTFSTRMRRAGKRRGLGFI